VEGDKYKKDQEDTLIILGRKSKLSPTKKRLKCTKKQQKFPTLIENIHSRANFLRHFFWDSNCING